MKVCVRELLEEKRFGHVYQPIWDLVNWVPFGYEALMRVSNSEIENIEQLFQQARQEGCLYELDTKAIENSIDHFPFSHFHQRLLFVNIYPSTILDERFASFLDQLLTKYPAIKQRVVFEISETDDEKEIWATDAFKEKLQTIKTHGFYVAIDDVGEGAFTFEKMIEIQPDYIKLDRQFAKELAMDRDKQKLISLFVSYCQPKKVLVLEGIEKEIDLAQAKLLQVSIAQGYLLGEPEKL
ncbi:EAL domain-containing protein (putative c-di-GMP-specific phosphodiesterase class I) [Anoxybacillus tepidamans]|uniref:EAL domain-containing protein (Putative c-di-GMP-specific phosphodiesterase class I) n=1 Tax=Anoxybacteroides tepidamans TaxID=265948 RepID=A0A7W8IRQ2_9BACL|nr:EAL domain-containing protein [Anoxybacillus tepidamans]MBB5325473.1 EAL domain-containing protein (putative c-di-GMP-specific phosphodiesterase class I) [Anoxybacillus tepidamans]